MGVTFSTQNGAVTKLMQSVQPLVTPPAYRESAADRIRRIAATATRYRGWPYRDASTLTSTIAGDCCPVQLTAQYQNTSGLCKGSGSVTGTLTLTFSVSVTGISSVLVLTGGGQVDITGAFAGAAYPTTTVTSDGITRNCDTTSNQYTVQVTTPQGVSSATFTIPAYS